MTALLSAFVGCVQAVVESKNNFRCMTVFVSRLRIGGGSEKTVHVSADDADGSASIPPHPGPQHAPASSSTRLCPTAQLPPSPSSSWIRGVPAGNPVPLRHPRAPGSSERIPGADARTSGHRPSSPSGLFTYRIPPPAAALHSLRARLSNRHRGEWGFIS